MPNVIDFAEEVERIKLEQELAFLSKEMEEFNRRQVAYERWLNEPWQAPSDVVALSAIPLKRCLGIDYKSLRCRRDWDDALEQLKLFAWELNGDDPAFCYLPIPEIIPVEERWA